MRRLAQAFHVASWPSRGTAVLARVMQQGVAAPPDETVGGLSVPMPGEQACGDGWASHTGDQTTTLFVVDGLGHGVEAARAANEALQQFQRQPEAPVAELIEDVHLAHACRHGAARSQWRASTRAACTVAYAGLGNIAAALVSTDGQVRHLVSLNGIAGHNARKIHAFEYPCTDGTVDHAFRWPWHRLDVAPVPWLHATEPDAVGRPAVSRLRARRDDATVVVARTGGS